MSQPDILNKVKYRLQNVDYGTFLERRGKRTLVLRPLKMKSKNQQWIFVQPDPRKRVYELRNIDDEDWVLSGRLTSNNTDSLSVTKSSSTSVGKTWKFYNDAPRENDHLYMVSSDLGDDENVLAFVQNATTAVLEYDANLPSDFNKVNKSEEYQWRLVEVTPASLPDGDDDGKYRIRTLNGLVIHSQPGEKRLYTKTRNQNRGDHRAWEISDLGNGKCTLRNVLEKKFLGVEKDRATDRWVPVLTDTIAGQEWFIEVSSDFSWSICIWREVSHNGIKVKELLSLSLNEDTVILKQWKAAHNQIWMIESTDAPTNIPEGGQDGGGDGGGGGGGGNNTEILPGSDIIPGRDYKVFNNSGTYGIVVELQGATGSYRFLVTAKGGRPSPSDLNVDVRSRGQRGEVAIYYEFQGNTYYLTLDNGSVVGKTTQPYYWIVEQDPASKLFLIRDSKSQLVVSAPATQNASLVTKQRTSDSTTLWSFES